MHLPHVTVALALSTAFYVIGYSAGIAAFSWLARKRGIATEGIFILMAAGLIGGLIGANLTQYLATGLPGKTVLGGIATGYLCVVIAKRLLGIRRPTGDLFALGISAGEAIGRWGCFFAGCCGGKIAPRGLPWAVWQDGAWRHPSQAYDSIANAAIFVLLLRLLRRNPPENMLFFVQGVLYCAARFAIEYYRESSAAAAGLTLAQWACLAGFSYFGIRLALMVRSRRRLIMQDGETQRTLSEPPVAAYP